jgi:hypothetical protein
MTKKITQFAFLSVALAYAGAAWAMVPDLIPVQGFLTDSGTGDPIDGLTDMQFDIYDAQTSGTLLWSSVYNSTTEQVDVNQGYFSVYLGELTAAPLDFSPMLGEAELWLQLTVSGEAMDRIRMASTAFSEQAQYCSQIGDMQAGDIQPSLGAPCDEGSFLRGWDSDANAPICAEDQVEPSATQYLNISGLDLIGEYPQQNLRTTNWGAVFRAANGSYTNASAPVHLPHGATVTKMTVWVLDNVDAANERVDVRLGRRSIALSAYVDGWSSSNPSLSWLSSLATADSTGASANIQMLESGTLSTVVDNDNYDYSLFVMLGGTSTAQSNLVFFRARIEYTM